MALMLRETVLDKTQTDAATMPAINQRPGSNGTSTLLPSKHLAGANTASAVVAATTQAEMNEQEQQQLQEI